MTEIETLIATENIRKQLYLYCKAIDGKDWDFLRTCFGDEHVHQHGAFTGSADEFIGFARKTLAKIKVCQHSIANVLVEFSDDGLSAKTEANFSAVHLIEAAMAPSMHFEAGNVDTDWIVAGCYHDRWVYRDGGWLIIERKAQHLWERIEPSRLRVAKTHDKPA